MAKKISQSAEGILQAALKRKQQRQPAYSLRAFARDLGVSPAFASKLINGQKAPPKERLEKLSFLLELDVLEKEALVKDVLLDSFGEKVLSRAQAAKKGRKTVEAPSGSMLSSWANLAVLEGLTLEAPHNDPSVLGARLGLSTSQVARSLETLSQLGLIEKGEEGWKKKEQHLYVAGGRSKSEVRAFHTQMIEKAKGELLKTSQADYDRRLINGFTMALNPEHMHRLKSKIIQFLDDLSREASEGPTSEIYQCNMQLFPLSKASR